MNNEIVIFDNQTVKLEVNMKDETVWLSANQIAKLFDRDYKTIRKHINNVLKDELNGEKVVAKFATTTIHGSIKDKTQTKLVDYYNLDVIISVGYRVKSKNGIIFRKWANKVLKDYLIKGYVLNDNRLKSLEKVVKLIDIASRIEDGETKDIIKIIDNYSKSLTILDNYDNNIINKVNGTISNKKIKYKDCINIIKELKKKEISTIFALERNKGLDNIINNIYQTYNNKDVYESIEEKGANFLYLIIKDHIFIDGNKRIGATLFIYFLNYYGLLYKNNKQIIDNNLLASITLLVALSNPKEKDIIISLIINFLI